MAVSITFLSMPSGIIACSNSILNISKWPGLYFSNFQLTLKAYLSNLSQKCMLLNTSVALAGSVL